MWPTAAGVGTCWLVFPSFQKFRTLWEKSCPEFARSAGHDAAGCAFDRLLSAGGLRCTRSNQGLLLFCCTALMCTWLHSADPRCWTKGGAAEAGRHGQNEKARCFSGPGFVLVLRVLDYTAEPVPGSGKKCSLQCRQVPEVNVPDIRTVLRSLAMDASWILQGSFHSRPALSGVCASEDHLKITSSYVIKNHADSSAVCVSGDSGYGARNASNNPARTWVRKPRVKV